ncbi:MAG: hypothetical protein ACREVR_19625 [Burkholderiales bacterium]
MNCHLLVSDLFWPASAGNQPYGGLQLPSLETLLARGKRVKTPGGSLERWLAGQYGLSDGLPLAPFSLRGDGGEPGADCWMRADPVHLKVHGDRLVLADESRLAVTPDEAWEFVAAVNSHFAGEGISLIAPRPQRWYLRTANEPRLRTTPTSEAAGRNVEPLLPDGDDGARWRRIINEAQMLLHQHPCNEARERQDQLAVNSIWLWGPGRNRSLSAPYDTFWTDHPLAAGLAAAGGAAARPLPTSGDFLLEARRDGRQLVVLSLPATAYGDLADWRDAVAMLERLWIAPLLSGLQDAALQSLTLHGLGPDYGYTSTLTRRDRLRFWRVRRPLHAYAT